MAIARLTASSGASISPAHQRRASHAQSYPQGRALIIVLVAAATLANLIVLAVAWH